MKSTKKYELKKLLFICLGFSFLILAYFGIVMPGVPAIPFILLALFFFSNSSDKWHQWMLRQKIIAKIISKTQTRKGKLGFKLFVISQLWVSIIIAEYLFVSSYYYGILLVIIGAGFSYVTYLLMDT